jgi:hypothetical protein
LALAIHIVESTSKFRLIYLVLPINDPRSSLAETEVVVVAPEPPEVPLPLPLLYGLYAIV